MYSIKGSFGTDRSVGFWQEPNFLSEDEINMLIQEASKLEMEPALMANKAVNDAVRHNNISWIYPDRDNPPIFELFRKVVNKVIEVNNRSFEYVLTDIGPLQYTQYDTGEFYKRHLDIDKDFEMGNTQRKLSFSIQLSDPNTYKGGDLRLHTSEVHTDAQKDRGSIIFFPSWMMHQVTPVTEGTRISLVGWAWGPKFT